MFLTYAFIELFHSRIPAGLREDISEVGDMWRTKIELVSKWGSHYYFIVIPGKADAKRTCIFHESTHGPIDLLGWVVQV